MGARLVSRAMLVLPQLETHAARTVLLVMAHMAKDTDPAPAYFAGSVYLAQRLGYDVQEEEDDAVWSVKGQPWQKAVARALEELGPATARQREKLAEFHATGEIRRPIVGHGLISQVNATDRRSPRYKRKWLLTLPKLGAVEETPVSPPEEPREEPDEEAPRKTQVRTQDFPWATPGPRAREEKTAS